MYNGPGLLLLSLAWEWDGDEVGLAAQPKTRGVSPDSTEREQKTANLEMENSDDLFADR